MKHLPILITLIILVSCESKRAANKTAWLERKGYLKDSFKTETKFIQGETKLIKDTTFISSSDTLRTDSTLVITNNYYHEKHYHTRDSFIITNNKTTHFKQPCQDKPNNFWKGFGIGILFLTGLIILFKFVK